MRYVLSLGVCATLALLLSFLNTFGEKNLCSMSYSRPVFYQINIPSPYSLLNDRYQTFLYREGGLSRQFTGPESLGNTPVLFIPGNAGSYSQGRSIASLCANWARDQGSDIDIDFFSIHFSEDLSAMHGQTLLDQARYVNDAIFYILDMYKGRQNSPSSVIVISHSMGGIVARTLVTLDNYAPNSVNTILTLSTPHLVPPLTLDKGITEIYDRVNQYWRSSTTNVESEEDLESDDMALISISGGHTDLMVPPEYTPIHSIVSSSHGLSAYSYSIPRVWRGMDHLAIVWCFELRQVIVESLFAIVDPAAPKRTKPRVERMSILEEFFRSPIDAKENINANNSLWWSEESFDGSFTTPIGFMQIENSKIEVPPSVVSMPINLSKEGDHVSLLKLLLLGINIPVDSKFKDVRLSSVGSSMWALRVSVVAPRSLPDPVALRHWVPSTGESRWYTSTSTRMFWYSNSPFVPFPADGDDCLHVQVIAPKLAEGTKAKVNISIDLWASLANIGIRYRTVAFCFPLAIVLITVLIQLRSFYRGQSLSFTSALHLFVSRYFAGFLLVVMWVQLMLCASPIRNIIRAIQLPSERTNVSTLRYSKYDITDLLAGNNEPLLVPVPALLLLISAAFVLLIDQLLNLTVTYVLGPISRRASSHEACKERDLSPVNMIPPGTGFVSRIHKVVPWISSPLECLNVVFALVVLYFVPYQLSFVLATLWQLLRLSDASSWNYTIATVLLWSSLVDVPMFAVWLDRLRFEWAFAFATPTNITSAAPTILLVTLASRQSKPTPPILASLWSKTVLFGTLGYMVYYALMHGFMHSFMMHFFTNYLCAVILVLAWECYTEKKIL